MAKNGIKEKLIAELDNLTPAERKAVLKSIKGGRTPDRSVDHSKRFSDKVIRFGVYSDPHMGCSEFREELWHTMLARFRMEGIKTVYCPGDNLEGMSGRPGHVYELSHIGFEAQAAYASSLFALAPEMQFFIIDGNHDLWFKKKGDMGISAGQQLANRNPNVTFLGEWEADVRLAENLTMRLFHAADGTAYADSYKLQKLIESFTGGTKPNIVLSGHYHKQIAVFRRNVFGFECGTLCGQTEWMRGKKIPAHMGFLIIEVWVDDDGGVERLRSEFFPHYD